MAFSIYDAGGIEGRSDLPPGWIGNPNPGLPDMPQLPTWATPGYKPPTPKLPGGGGVVTQHTNMPPPPSPTAPFKPVAGSGPQNPVAPPPAGPAIPNFDQFPGVIAAKNAENMGLSQLESALQRAREQLIIRFGDPALASMAGFGLDPQAGVFAKQNYLSGNADLARLEKAHNDRKRAIINRLAGRGILDSGDLGYLSGEESQVFGNQQYDARQQVLSQLRELADRFMQQKQALRDMSLNAYQGAYQSFLQNPDAYLGAF